MSSITQAMTLKLLELVKDKKHALYPPSTKKEFTKTSNAAWTELCDIMTIAFPSNPKDVKQWRKKIDNLKVEAKKYSSTIKASMSETGGGPPPAVDDVMEKVAEIFGDGHDWHGVEKPIKSPLFLQQPPATTNMSTAVSSNAASSTRVSSPDTATPIVISSKIHVKRPRDDTDNNDEVPIAALQRQLLQQELKNAKQLEIVLTQASDFFKEGNAVLVEARSALTALAIPVHYIVPDNGDVIIDQ